MDLLTTLKGTPLPVILTVGGIVFLFLAIVGNIKQLQTEPLQPVARRWAAGVGTALLIAGIVLYVTPVETPGTESLPAPQVAATEPPPTAAEPVTAAPVATQEATELSEKNAQGYPVMIDDKGIGMVLIPSGSFLMGSDDGFPDEKPVRPVMLTRSYWMDSYEVTNRAYSACVDALVCAPPHSLGSGAQDSYYPAPQYADYPVIFVDWYMADTFCTKWRGGRLPTEAEWEFAARGKDQRKYAWGGSQPDCTLLNFVGEGDCAGDTRPATDYPGGVSPFGLYNMNGNVWEWVQDLYATTYTGIPSQDPVGALTGSARGLRGGSWSSDAENVSTSVRYSKPPEDSGSNIGIRCARTP